MKSFKIAMTPCYVIAIAGFCFGQSRWTPANTPAAANYNGVAYVDSQYIVLGNNGVIVTSPDAHKWTNRSSGVGAALYSVAFANGLFVVVGASGTILTSSDGITWAADTSPLTSNWLLSVTYANGQFIAVEDRGAILSSVDGHVWTIRNSGSLVAIQSVVYGKDQFVAVGSQSVLSSTDGTSWTTHPFVLGQSAYFTCITYAESLYVATSQVEPGQATPMVLVSSDAVTWRSFDAPNNLFSVTYGDGQFVAVGLATILTSPDGQAWTVKAFPSGIAPTFLKSVAFGAGQFVAVGDGIIISSLTQDIKQTSSHDVPKAAHSSITYSGSMIRATIPGVFLNKTREVAVYRISGEKIFDSSIQMFTNTASIPVGCLAQGRYALVLRDLSSRICQSFSVSH
jgi:hypothetical protein